MPTAPTPGGVGAVKQGEGLCALTARAGTSSSAAAAGAAAALADVAGAGGAHLGAAGEAERAVDGVAGDLLEELGAGVRRLGGLGRDLALVGAVAVVGDDGLGVDHVGGAVRVLGGFEARRWRSSHLNHRA